MNAFALIVVYASSAVALGDQRGCAHIPIAEVATRLSDLSPEIRTDLMASYKDMGDRNTPLLKTDAPTAREQGLATSRFIQAVRIKDEWFVQYEWTFGGRRTLGYFRGSNGHYQRAPYHYLSGPFCKTLQAIKDGIGNPGGLHF